MIKLMIADDNKSFSKTYGDIFSKDKNIQIVSFTYDGINTLNEYNKKKPDVLLLDLDLPKMNGLEVIDNLSLDLKERKKCNIIIISGDITKRTNLYNTSKIYRVFSKPIDHELVLETIKEIAEENSQTEFSEKRVRDLLLALNFNIHSTGSVYLLDAISIAYKKPELITNTKKLYEIVGRNYNVNFLTVNNKIRNSLETMLRISSDEEIRRVLPLYHCGRGLTPKYLITLIVDYFD